MQRRDLVETIKNPLNIKLKRSLRCSFPIKRFANLKQIPPPLPRVYPVCLSKILCRRSQRIFIIAAF